jgi:hypothetical protein
MLKTYEKCTGDDSLRIESEYRPNEAGAKQFVLDQLTALDRFNGSPDIMNMHQVRITGQIEALRAFGLINVFDFHDLNLKLLQYSFAYNSRLLEIPEQI